MPPPDELQDLIHRGLNSAARVIGADTCAYRPSGPVRPLDPANRFLRLRAAFSVRDGSFTQGNRHGDALWYGVFDAAYTRPGDYLVQGQSVWFVAAQRRLHPVLCVQTNRIVSFSRPAAPLATGVNDYGGITAETNLPLLTDWPASVFASAGRGHPEADLPSDVSVPYWNVLLPAIAGVLLRPADIIVDDLCRQAVVASAELTDLGWRVTAKQANT